MNALRTLAAAGAIALLAVSSPPPGPASALGEPYARFGFALLEDLQTHQSAPLNVFVSPASVAIALAMTADGAAGTTRTAMLKTLGATGMSPAQFDAANAAAIAQLDAPGAGISLSVANALWLNKDFTIEPAFLKAGRSVFGATARNLDFGAPAAANTINGWVKEHTAGLIPTIVDSTQPDQALVLTNAIALKAKWATPFKSNATHDAPFHLAGGGTKTVSMMSQSGPMEYATTGGMQIARLPYCCDGRFAMYVMLPREGVSLAAAAHALGAGGFERAAAAVASQRVLFQMPRYTATYEATLNDSLERLGMGVAFGKDADFANMVAPPQRVLISRVNHRVFVRVDEAGTEAAAATAVTMETMALIAPPPTRMIVDRPFLMAIRDDQTKQLLFLGAIASP